MKLWIPLSSSIGFPWPLLIWGIYSMSGEVCYIQCNACTKLGMDIIYGCMVVVGSHKFCSELVHSLSYYCSGLTYWLLFYMKWVKENVPDTDYMFSASYHNMHRNLTVHVIKMMPNILEIQHGFADPLSYYILSSHKDLLELHQHIIDCGVRVCFGIKRRLSRHRLIC